MRVLYEEIEEYYLLREGLSKEPSSPIESDKYGENHKTKLTTYSNDSEFETPSRYHKDYSGVTHSVSWKTNNNRDNLSNKEKKDTLHDAMHLHHHFVKRVSKPGDIVKNTPLEDENRKGGNKRARIYAKQAGFGEMSSNGTQYGIVKQHPHDHPDESKRGQQYLHPLEHRDIAAQGDEPSAGASDNQVRHISKQVGNQHWHQTKMNSAIHNLVNDDDKPGHHEIEYNLSNKHKPSDLKDLITAHKASLEKHTKIGDKVSKRLYSDDSGLKGISTNHVLGMGSPKSIDAHNRISQHGIVNKRGELVPHND